MTVEEAAIDGYRLSLKAPRPLAGQIADALSELALPSPPAVSLFERERDAPWGVAAYFETEPDIELVRQALAHLADPLPALTLEPIASTNWVRLVQQGLCPVKAGRFFIYGHHDRASADHRRGQIEINAGQAFGTAHHGTTQGCLLALDALFKRRTFRRVLDLGTGTGVLAIAAARLTHRPVWASDIDPIAVRIARENAALNEIGQRLHVVEADGLSHPALTRRKPYDLLIANILAGPLKAMSPKMREFVGEKGCLVLSGLLIDQSRMIESCYKSQGFVVAARFPIDEWMTLILRRRNRKP